MDHKIIRFCFVGVLIVTILFLGGMLASAMETGSTPSDLLVTAGKETGVAEQETMVTPTPLGEEIPATPDLPEEATATPDLPEEATATPDLSEEVTETPGLTEDPATLEPVQTTAPVANEVEESKLVAKLVDETNPNRIIKILALWEEGKEVLEYGDKVIFKAKLIGYEGLSYKIRWQYKDSALGWQDIKNGVGEELPIVLSEENSHWQIRVQVDIVVEIP